MQSNELCVPASSMAVSGGDDSAPPVSPEVGDEVEVTIKGKVTRSEGGNVYLKPTEANGEPLSGDDSEEMPMHDENSDMDSFMDKAGKAQDEGMGY